MKGRLLIIFFVTIILILPITSLGEENKTFNETHHFTPENNYEEKLITTNASNVGDRITFRCGETNGSVQLRIGSGSSNPDASSTKLGGGCGPGVTSQTVHQARNESNYISLTIYYINKLKHSENNETVSITYAYNWNGAIAVETGMDDLFLFSTISFMVYVLLRKKQFHD
ncbi:MAG: hypothetical protein ACXAB7_15645 [Candidatus Kariarchaeaceae archaeon]|jgi:hypothetical protein